MSQSYNYRHFTPKDGLPSSEVYHVFQDSKGYIWFSTDNGVCRYDGYNFRTFSSKDNLPDNTIFEVYEDWMGRIWFISFSAKLSFFYNDSIYKYKYNNAIAKELSHYPVSNKKSFYFDKNKDLYFSDRYNGIIKVSDLGKTELLSDKYLVIIKDSIALLNRSVYPDNDSLYLLWENTELNGKIEMSKFGFRKRTAALLNDFLFFSIYNKLYKYSKSGLKQSIKFDGEVIWLSKFKQQVWVGTTLGAFCFENGDLYSSPKYKLLLGNAISSVLTDREGGIWLTTLENGIFYLPCLEVMSVRTNDEEINYPRITSLHEYNNQIWYGTYEGEFGVLKNGELNPLFQTLGIKTCQPVNDIINNESGNLIVLTVCDSYFLSLKSKNSTSIDKSCIQTTTFGGTNIIRTGKNGYNLVNRSAINYFNFETKEKFSRFKISKGASIYSVLQLDEDKLLVGTSSGLWMFYPETKKFLPLDIHPKLKDRIICLMQDKNGIVWVGTKTNGVLALKNNVVVCLLGDYDIESNYIKSVFSHNNSVWIATKGGGGYQVSFRDSSLKEYNIRKWSVDDGILSNEVNDIVTNDTAAFIATNKGLNIIKYADYKSVEMSPLIHLKSIKINNQDTLLLNNYALKYNQNSIEIILTGLTYRYPGKLMYKYRLCNSEKEGNWTTTSNRNISFAYLSPGSYQFQAKALNGKNESNESINIGIEILPPFWKTWWFIISSSNFAIFLIVFLIRRRLLEIKKRNDLEKQFLINKNELQREIEKYRQQALTQQMNPHFIFNSLNSIQLFVYQENKKLSSKYLSKFSRLIRIILENSQHQAIPFQKEFDALILYLELEEMRLQGKLNFIVDLDKKINTSYYLVPPLLIQPFVENAIWHGIVHKQGKGTVKIILEEHQEMFLCIIEDDGVGREKAKQIRDTKTGLHKSLGIEITQKRLELLSNRFGKKMSIVYKDLLEKDNVVGTRVELIIPKFTSED